jgi:hypothetical protein
MINLCLCLLTVLLGNVLGASLEDPALQDDLSSCPYSSYLVLPWTRSSDPTSTSKTLPLSINPAATLATIPAKRSILPKDLPACWSDWCLSSYDNIQDCYTRFQLSDLADPGIEWQFKRCLCYFNSGRE